MVWQIVQTCVSISRQSWGSLSEWLLLYCRLTGPRAELDYLIFYILKNTLYATRQCFLLFPLHAWHLPSTNETVPLAETQNTHSCSMSKPVALIIWLNGDTHTHRQEVMTLSTRFPDDCINSLCCICVNKTLVFNLGKHLVRILVEFKSFKD